MKYILSFFSLILTACHGEETNGQEYIPTVEPIAIETEEKSSSNTPAIDIADFMRNYLIARITENEGQRDEAALAYSAAQKAFPNYQKIHEKTFHLQLASGDWDEAVRLSKELILQEDPLPLTYLVLGVHAVSQQAYSEARRYFDSALKLSPELVHLHLIHAYLDLATGKDVSVATAKVRNLPYNRLLSAVKHYHLGLMFLYQNNLEEALLEFKLAYEQDGSSLFTLKGLAHTLILSDKKDEAANLFKDFFTENPENLMARHAHKNFLAGKPFFESDVMLLNAIGDVLFNLATVMNSQHAPFSAHQLLTMASALMHDSSFISFYHGLLYEQEGLTEQALNYYRLIPKNHELYLPATVRRATSLESRGNVIKAIRLLETILDDHPEVMIKRILAEMYYSAENFDAAINMYDDVIASLEKAPREENAWIFFARGSSHERLRHYHKATADLEIAIELKPDNATALNYLGYMLVDMETDIERGMKLISRALILKPNDAAILDSMGWAWYKKGAYEKALTFLEKAAEKLSQDATINMHLGDTYNKLGREREAKLHWQRALKLGPDTKRDQKYLKKQLNR